MNLRLSGGAGTKDALLMDRSALRFLCPFGYPKALRDRRNVERKPCSISLSPWMSESLLSGLSPHFPLRGGRYGKGRFRPPSGIAPSHKTLRGGRYRKDRFSLSSMGPKCSQILSRERYREDRFAFLQLLAKGARIWNRFPSLWI